MTKTLCFSKDADYQLTVEGLLNLISDDISSYSLDLFNPDAVSAVKGTTLTISPDGGNCSIIMHRPEESGLKDLQDAVSDQLVGLVDGREIETVRLSIPEGKCWVDPVHSQVTIKAAKALTAQLLRQGYLGRADFTMAALRKVGSSLKIEGKQISLQLAISEKIALSITEEAHLNSLIHAARSVCGWISYG